MADEYKHLIPEFLQAMDEIGAYGHDKYGVESFQHRRAIGDRSRGELKRCKPQVIADHARDHFDQYLSFKVHDHFGTDKHQLAAVAFNAMMEFFFAGLDESADCTPASTPILEPSAKSLILVGEAGLEPTTPGLEGCEHSAK